MNLKERATEKINNSAYLMNKYDDLCDPKVLVVVMNNIHQAMQDAISAFLASENEKKNISVMPKDFKTQIQLMREEFGGIFTQDQYETIQKLRNLKKQESQIQFNKKGEIFIFEQDHQITRINKKKMEKYLKYAKKIIAQLK